MATKTAETKVTVAGDLVSDKNVYQRYLAVMEECGYVQKQGVNSFHNYRYAMASQVLEKVNEACVRHGIATQAYPEIVSVETPTNRKGELENRVTVRMRITLVNVDNPEERMVLYGLGTGQDAGDKAVMKAQTAAVKYGWMMGLNISTGDDPEADASVDERMSDAAQGNTKPAGKKPQAQKAPDKATGKAPAENGKHLGETATRKQAVWNGMVEFFKGDQVKAKKALLAKCNKPSKEWSDEDLVQLEGYLVDVTSGVIDVSDVVKEEGL